MKQPLALIALFLVTAACAHQGAPSGATAPSRLEATPRHDEWITVPSAGRPLHLYVVYPQLSRTAGTVIVIHENRGLTDWVRGVADQLAERGYIAVAPDFLSGAGPGGGRTSAFPSQDAAREAISKLPREQVMADLNNTLGWVRSVPSANGKVAVAGFCWGGSRTFDFANVGRGLTASFVFYGGGPSEDAAVRDIEAPVYGFYGGDDERVNATIPATREAMQRQGKQFDPVVYPGAGHAFMRLGEEPDASPANRQARDQAWTRWLTMLRALD
jgi:carboxymethylenebutenolidase